MTEAGVTWYITVAHLASRSLWDLLLLQSFLAGRDSCTKQQGACLSSAASLHSSCGSQEPANPTHKKPFLLVYSSEHMPWQCLGLGTKPNMSLGQDRATYTSVCWQVSVCRIIHERIGWSADCSEHCSIAPKTFNMLALKPLRNAISCPGSWQAMTMRLGRPVYAQPCLSADWQ